MTSLISVKRDPRWPQGPVYNPVPPHL